ncbi:MAG: hypothetical protein WAU07_00975 [Microgenomates group bacterium]
MNVGKILFAKSLASHFFLVITVLVFSFFINVPQAQAQCAGPQDVGNCVNNQICIEYYGEFLPMGGECGSSSIGSVSAPQGVHQYNLLAGTYGTTTASGLVVFASRAMQVASIVAGIFMMINLVRAGFIYITKFDQVSAHQDVRDLLTYSVVGLVIMVSAYAGGGLIGLVFFGDASFVLSPTLEGAVPPP